MTITQLEYLLALDTYRHFIMAAESCHVTQPTLSMQIQKLEDELGVKIFDRTRQPVIPTEIGTEIIAQARIILREAGRIGQIIARKKDSLFGELKIGIIPTLAPYLLPSLFKTIMEKYPEANLKVKEAITEELIVELKNNRLDCIIAVSPLNDPSVNEELLFYEELFVYVSKKNALYNRKFLLAKDINPEHLWLLEEGHCFRSQVLNLCELRRGSDFHFNYETGNIETLKRMVDKTDGITILPELAVRELPKAQLKRVKRLKEPGPVRMVSLITHRNHLKNNFIKSIKEVVLKIVPNEMHENKNKKIVELNY